MSPQPSLENSMKRISIGAVTLMAMLTSHITAEENSPQFRGADSTAVIRGDQTPPTEWGPDKNIRWTRPLPGEGWSGPIVWGTKVFLTSAEPIGQPTPPRGGRRQPGGQGGRAAPDVVYRWKVHCLDRNNGKTLWEQISLEAKPRIPKHRDNTYASETPVTDGKRVYAYFGMTGLFAYDLDGKLLWKKDLGVFPMQAGWGTSSSPVVLDDHLYLQIDNEEKSFLVALDTATGEERWRVSRDEKSNWSNPIIWKNKVRTELVTSGSTARSYDPNTGELLWELTMSGRASSTPVGISEMLYLGTEDRTSRGGTPGGLFAVKAGAKGNITPKRGETTSEYVAWSRPKSGPEMASPLVYDGYVYTLGRRIGMVNCYDATTGEPAYERERLRGARAFWASPWAYDGKIFCPDDDGTTHVLNAGPEFEILRTNQLPGRTWATPAVTESALVIRAEDVLYCVGR